MFEYALVFGNTGEIAMQAWTPARFRRRAVKEMAEELSVQGILISFRQGELPETVWEANPFLYQTSDLESGF